MNRILLISCLLAGLTLFHASPLSARFRVELPYTEEGGKLIIEATVNGHKGRFVVDTGAPCCVTHSFAEKLQLTTGTTLPAQDSNGNVIQTRLVTLDYLKLSDVSFAQVQAVSLEAGNAVETFGIDGVFGYNLMRKGILKINGKDRKFTFTDYGSDLGMVTRYGIPLVDDPYLTKLVVRIGKSQRDTVMFDSGSSRFYSLSTAAYHRLSAEKGKGIHLLGQGKGILSIGIAGLERPSVKYRVKIPQLQLGNAVFKDATSITTDATSSRIGTDILKYGNIIIDYLSHTFYYLPFDPDKTPRLYEKEWDVALIVQQGHLTAGLVWDYAKIPLTGGEQIVEVAGKRYDRVDLRQATTSAVVAMPGDRIEIKYIAPKSGEEKRAEIRKR